MLKSILNIGLFLFITVSSFGSEELDYVYDLHTDRAKLEAQRSYRHKQLYDKGITSREAHLNVDKKFLNKARKLETRRQRAVKALFDKAGIELPQQMGTNPKTGRGILGDIDTANMDPGDVKKLLNVIEKHNNTPGVKHRYNVSDKGGYVHIKELDTTAFRKMNNPDDFVFTRGAGKETALAYRTNTSGDTANQKIYKIGKDGKKVLISQKNAVVVDKNIYNLDNMKKVGADFSQTDIKKVDFQNTGKGTMRIIENTYGKNLEKITDPVKKAEMQKLLAQCRDMKSYSPETAGLHTEADKKKFMGDAKKVIGEAYRECAGQTETAMVKQRDASWKKIEDLKKRLKQSRGQNPELKAELDATRKFYDAENAELYKYRQKKLAAERGVIKNGGTELLAEAKGRKIKKIRLTNGTSRFIDVQNGKVATGSQMENDLLGNQRKNLIDADMPPHKTHGTKQTKVKPLTPNVNTPSAKGKFTIGTNQTFQSSVNRAGDVVDIYNTYKTVDSYLPQDMDPATRKGMLLAITAASSNQVVRSTIQGTIGGGQAGFDELVKWYKEHPGREPTRWEMMKIGMRGGNNFVKNLAKDTAYGMTVKPFKDVYDIGYGLGDTIYQRRNAEQAAKATKAMDNNVNSSYIKKIDALHQRLARVNNLIIKLKADPLSDSNEKTYAARIATESALAAKLVHNAKITATTRNDEVSTVKEIKDPKTGKTKKVIVSSRTTIDERRNAVAFAASYVDKVEKMAHKLMVMRNTCSITINLLDAVTGHSIAPSSWMTVKSGSFSIAPRGNGSLKAANVPGGACQVQVKAVGYKTPAKLSLSLDPTKKRHYSYSLKLIPAPAQAALYAKFTLAAFDSKTKKPVNNVTFKVINNQRTTNFTSPNGAMSINLETGKCQIRTSAHDYKQGYFSFDVDTSSKAKKIKYIYMKKNETEKAHKSYSKNRKFTVYIELTNPSFKLPRKTYSLKMVNIENNTPVKLSESTRWRAYTYPGKYKITLSGANIKTVVKTFTLNRNKMVVDIPFAPKSKGITYTFSLTLPKLDQMVEYEKVDSFLKSKTKKQYLFTIEREGYLVTSLYGSGQGSSAVVMLDHGKSDFGSLIGYTHFKKGSRTTTSTSTERVSKTDKGKKIIARAQIFSSHVKRSRKSDYDDKDRVQFPGGTFRGKVTFYTLPLKTKSRK